MQIYLQNEHSAFPQVSCDLYMADMRVQLVRGSEDTTTVRVMDLLACKTATIICTHAQAAAIIALAIGGEEYPDILTQHLYTLIGNEIDALPMNLRPIP